MAYPRTCQICGLGPCQKEPGLVRYTDAASLAGQIADKVYPHHFDQRRRDELAALLTAFADEIKRSAIEP